MVWKLGDLCLQSVQDNLASYPHLGTSLPTVFKEMLIERLACHDRFFPQQIKHINKSLFSSALRHIDLANCEQITDEILKLLSASRCQLESLKLKRLDEVTDAGVQAVLKKQPELIVVQLKHLPQVTLKALSSLASTKLTTFVFIQRNKTQAKNATTISAMQSFFANNSNIKYLKLSSAVEFLPMIAEGLNSSLEEIETNVQSLTDEGIDVLAANCPNLKKLDLNGAKNVGKDALINLFQTCTQLEELDLGYCTRLTSPSECQVMWTLPQSLTTLSLIGLMLKNDDIFVEAVTRLPKITSLKLCGVTALNDASLTKIVERIGSQLLTLNLSGFGGSEVTDKGLAMVADHCLYLECLHISLLGKVTGSTLTPIFKSPERAARLRALGINSRELSESVLDLVVTKCHNLKYIDLSGLGYVTDNTVMTLADNAPKLNTINLKGCKQLSDKSICYLCGRCPLQSLVLSGLHSLTDKSIFCLASSCPQLEEVYLNACALVSPVVVQYLKDRCLKRLLVNHAIPNASPNQVMGKNLDTGEFCRVDLL